MIPVASRLLTKTNKTSTTAMRSTNTASQRKKPSASTAIANEATATAKVILVTGPVFGLNLVREQRCDGALGKIIEIHAPKVIPTANRTRLLARASAT
jgi:hypothetical protein